ncbi:MAG: SdrD B-like domain-containing protein [Chitinophagales bacterium]
MRTKWIDSTPNNGVPSENDQDDAVIEATELGSIGDYVWFDENGDGIQDPGEQGIPNVTVTLTYPDGTTVTTTTDDTGHYLFDNLPAGNYVVTVGEGPENYGLTTTGTYNVNLGSGEDFLNADFGFDTASLGNYVWIDSNANGIQDAGEQGLNGVNVILTDAAGNFVASTTTANGGYYLFDNLAAGNYIVTFELPDGYNFTTMGGGDDQNNTDSNANTTTGQTAVINLSVGENDMTIDGVTTGSRHMYGLMTTMYSRSATVSNNIL